ncbi:hypothetical protein [Pedobacter jejuensis]|uniref:Uncharacterized protein n=1 Tax=Pedobacter jejuensis TaxID=1268550 RepID=A0A3N0BQN6_9SPHI|nr:hypothetical protein [Pedobacter jejuensis]RNL50775.1 hypothetical protein D7004_17965 [Pedobacter jejuensis]
MDGGLGYTRKFGTSDRPVFQGYGKDIQLVQGGFGLDITGLVVGSYIPKGTPMIYDEATRLAKPLAVAEIYENAAANATTYKIKKGSRLLVGSNFSAVPGGAAYPITAINTTNSGYDSVTVGTTIGALNANDFVYGSSATGANSGSFGGVNGLLYDDVKVESGKSVSIVIRGTVYARRVPYSAGLAAALPDTIIYSQSR